MSAGSPPVAVITGASQGIGASLATAYREIGHAVVGTSRTIEASGDPMVVTVQGDNADPDTAERVVSPGVVRTPMHPAEAYEGLGALHPMGRLGEVDDVVRAVMYLEAAPFVTGEFLHVDGGQSAGH
jgi:NAD(P)-dependent dehydrogenase (short-subunit alcohol dehydrogenase family)